MTFNSNCPDCGVQEGGMHAPTCRRLRGQISGKTAMQVMNEKIESEIFKACGPTEEMFRRMVGINPHHRVFIKDDEVKVQGIDHDAVFMDEAPSFEIQTQPPEYNMQFFDHNHNKVGELRVDRETGKLTFEGNLDESAKQFAKHLAAHLQSIADGDRDDLLTDHPPAETSAMTEDDPEKVWPTRFPHQL